MLAPVTPPELPPPSGRFSAALRGFGPLGILSIAAIALTGSLVGPALVLLWAWASRTPWRERGLVRPKSWPRTIVLGIASGVALKLAMKAIVMPLLGAPPTNAAYQFLVGNTAALPRMLFAVVVGAGFGEELFWRGFLFERLGRLLRPGTATTVVTLVITSVLFALAHIQGQGIPGAEQALITGLVFGSMFAANRQIILPMIAHAAFDVAAVAIIYYGLETRVAHAFIR
jgi:membrane protease YdiL (CAAX protease family)